MASTVLLLTGIMAEKAGLSKRYQANTLKTRRVLSFHYLGQRVITDHRIHFRFSCFKRAKRYLQKMLCRNEHALLA